LKAPFWSAQADFPIVEFVFDDAFHNDPPLEESTFAGGFSVPAALLARALNAVDNVSNPQAPKLDEQAGWDKQMHNRVFGFQSDNGIPPGGFEAGRKTLLALDAHLQAAPPGPGPKPNPNPQPTGAATLTASCSNGSASVHGEGFAAGVPVTLTVDADTSPANEAVPTTKPDNTGGVATFDATIDLSKRNPGSHAIVATSLGSTVAAQVDCSGGQTPPTPDPNLVTQNELLVLTKYEFLHETERDALEDATRDLKGHLDPTPVPWGVIVAQVVGEAAIQFVYGGFEQVVRSAVKGLFPSQTGNPDAATLVDNANDKASDFLEDFGKDGLAQAIKEENQAPTKAVDEQVESFRRVQQASLRKGYLKVQTDWINQVRDDPATANITPDEVQGLGTALDQVSQKLYDLRYNNFLEAWDSYISRQKLGGRTETLQVNGGPTKEFSLTNLSQVAGKDPKDVPGVLLVGLRSGGGKDLPDPVQEGEGFAGVRIDQGDIHIFGMSETTRAHLAAGHPQFNQLNMPVVFRGETPTGGRVDIGRNTDGGIVDAGSDDDGRAWLVTVARTNKQDSSITDPAVGAGIVFSENLDVEQVEGVIQGP
jgi:hypothetical protein